MIIFFVSINECKNPVIDINNRWYLFASIFDLPEKKKSSIGRLKFRNCFFFLEISLSEEIFLFPSPQSSHCPSKMDYHKPNRMHLISAVKSPLMQMQMMIFVWSISSVPNSILLSALSSLFHCQFSEFSCLTHASLAC